MQSEKFRTERLGWPFLAAASLALALVLLSAGGCGQSDSSGSDGRANGSVQGYGPATAQTAEQVLRNMAAAYRHAAGYADMGRLRLRFERGDLDVDETANFSVVMARPNKLRLQCYQATVVSDGRQLRAAIDDLEGQVLSREAPDSLELENILIDDVLVGVLTEGIAGSAPQLALLLTDDPLTAILEGGQPPRLIEPATWEDRPCYRVAVARPDGELVFWIDQQSHLLRRIDYPVEGLREQLAAEGDVLKLALWAEFRGARFDDRIDDASFHFEMPGQAKLVSQFDVRSLVPPPPPPTKLLGQRIGDFEFTALDGSTVSRASLEGKIVVLDFWATWCGPCVKSLPVLNEVRQKLRGREDVVFLAVSIDESDVDDNALRETFAKLGVDVPIVRDTQRAAQQVFQIEGIPNLFVLGPDGTVQDNEVGINEQLLEQLPARLAALAAGENIFPQAQARYDERQAAYEESLNRPQSADQVGEPILQAEIAPRSQPQALTLEPLWECREVDQPGNILVLQESDGSVRLAVIDGWKRVAEIGPDGSLIEKRDFDVPGDAVISTLRTAVDRQGERWYLGAASTQPQVHLFGEDWQRRLSYPEGREAEIADFRLMPGADGQPHLIVGYWGKDGVEQATLSGQREWKNDTLENVFSIIDAMPKPGDRRLLCAHARGTVVELDDAGKRAGEISVGRRFIRAVTAADLDGDGVSELCGLAPGPQGSDLLVGFAADGTEKWKYDLPPGLHQQPIEMIGVARWPLGRTAWWLVAGADGSIHLLDAAGQPVDRFNYGQELTGLAATTIDGQPVLLVATAEGLTAWKVARKR